MGNAGVEGAREVTVGGKFLVSGAEGNGNGGGSDAEATTGDGEGCVGRGKVGGDGGDKSGGSVGSSDIIRGEEAGTSKM